jgi:hypothetical protein
MERPARRYGGGGLLPASDTLTRFAEDSKRSRNDATVALPAPLSHQGPSARPNSLDAVLDELHLSPFPVLVVGVDGETEDQRCRAFWTGRASPATATALFS